MRKRDLRVLVVAGVCTLLVAACAKPQEAGVRVKGIDADLVFGVEQPTVDATPANGLGADGLDTDFLGGDIALPEQFTTTKRVPRVNTIPKVPCPEAGGNAVVKEPSPKTNTDDQRPAVGVYRWKKAGKANTSGLVELPITGFEQRVIRNVRDVGKSTNTAGTPGSTNEPRTIFQYDTVQPDASGRIVESTYQVDPWSVTLTQYAPVGESQARTGASPERGIVLKGFDIKDNNGTLISSFHPTTGLLLMPLPTVDGDSWTSVAIDPATGQQATFQGQLLPRRDVDACGELVQGWVVKGTQTFSGSPPRSYEAVFAPQFGGVAVYEKLDQDDPATKTSIHIESTIGQVIPDPLPAK